MNGEINNMTKKEATSEQGKVKEFSIRSIIGPMLAVIVGMIMVILDNTVVNVAMPGLVEDFDSTLSLVQWTITGYTLALSAVIPLAGWMTDRFGAKRIFLISIVLFTLGSVLCSMAQSPEQLIIYRIIQGLGGGMVFPIGIAMIFRLAPPEKMGSVMGMLGIPMLLAPALGPIMSGWLVEYATWHWIFLINLPVGIIAVIVGLRYLPIFERKAVPTLDIWGMLLGPITFASLAYGVNQGGSVSWTANTTITALIIGGVSLLLFIFVELRHKQPLLELRVFRSADFTRGVMVSWISQIALFGSIIIMPLFLQNLMNYSPFETGLILLPQALGSAIFMPLGGRLFDKIGARPLAATGLTLISIALFLLSRVTLDTSLPMIMMSLGMIGAGMGLTMMPINTHVLKAAPRELVSRVTPLTTASQQVMTSFAVAGLTGFLVSRIKDHAAETGNLIDASVLAYGNTFLLTTSVALVGIVLALMLRKPKVITEEINSEQGMTDAAVIVGH
jgi:EmrB/QacA subfamily drug resistance transporter